MAQFDDLTKPHAAPGAPRGRSVLIFAALGVLSGVLCYLDVTYANVESLRFSFVPFGQQPAAAPIVPGIIFGVLVAVVSRHYGGKHLPLLGLAVLLTTIAWILAYDVTVKADSMIGDLRMTSDTIAVLSQSGGGSAETLRERWRNLVPQVALGGPISFALGGLVGGFGTALAVAIANARFCRSGDWLLTLAVATFFGAIEKLYDLMGDAGLLAMFVVWQAAVIASIARGLDKGEARPHM